MSRDAQPAYDFAADIAPIEASSTAAIKIARRILRTVDLPTRTPLSPLPAPAAPLSSPGRLSWTMATTPSTSLQACGASSASSGHDQTFLRTTPRYRYRR